MTRIDFYILPDSELNARYQFACKLVQKTFKMGHRIVIICEDEHAATKMDELLWSYQDTAFLPHKNLTELSDKDSDDIVIIHSGLENAPADHHDLLINIAAEIPAWFSRFERVSEVVVQTENVLNATRNNYKHYAERGYPLHRHDMR